MTTPFDLRCGDCIEVLATLEPNSVDACVTDPPYHLTSIVERFGAENAAPVVTGKTGAYARASAGFMGKQWDGGDIAFRPETWRAVMRVLKPGSYLIAFGSSRSGHRLATAIEDAGFMMHPFLAWIQGQGFPKAHRVIASGLTELDRATGGWEGWYYGGQALKPAIEPMYMAQKPFETGLTGTQNIIKWGTGAINIDGCRIETIESTERISGVNGTVYGTDDRHGMIRGGIKGRWPANVLHDGSAEATAGFPETGPSNGGSGEASQRTALNGDVYMGGWSGDTLGQNAGGLGDEGTAARYFYTAKADADDRLGSSHPTIKPLDLMQYLIRLVTPPGGLVVDPFGGTGTTGEAAFREGRRGLVIEREPEYQEDCRRRLALCMAGPDERARESAKAKSKNKPVDHGPLFGTG